jgi:hypothetical protein
MASSDLALGGPPKHRCRLTIKVITYKFAVSLLALPGIVRLSFLILCYFGRCYAQAMNLNIEV